MSSPISYLLAFRAAAGQALRVVLLLGSSACLFCPLTRGPAQPATIQLPYHAPLPELFLESYPFVWVLRTRSSGRALNSLCVPLQLNERWRMFWNFRLPARSRTLYAGYSQVQTVTSGFIGIGHLWTGRQDISFQDTWRAGKSSLHLARIIEVTGTATDHWHRFFTTIGFAPLPGLGGVPYLYAPGRARRLQRITGIREDSLPEPVLGLLLRDASSLALADEQPIPLSMRGRAAMGLRSGWRDNQELAYSFPIASGGHGQRGHRGFVVTYALAFRWTRPSPSYGQAAGLRGATRNFARQTWIWGLSELKFIPASVDAKRMLKRIVVQLENPCAAPVAGDALHTGMLGAMLVQASDLWRAPALSTRASCGKNALDHLSRLALTPNQLDGGTRAFGSALSLPAVSRALAEELNAFHLELDNSGLDHALWLSQPTLVAQ